MKQITIYDLTPLLKKGWVAMDRDGTWAWFSTKPYKSGDMWIWAKDWGYRSLTRAFNIAPFDGDWGKSLIRVGGKTKKKKKQFLDDLTEEEVKAWGEAYN